MVHATNPSFHPRGESPAVVSPGARRVRGRRRLKPPEPPAEGRHPIRRHADLAPLTETILETRRRVSPRRGVLVALTGIDGSGKGYVTTRLASALREQGVRVAVLDVDGWLNLPHVRFNPSNGAEHSYRNAIRFDPMFRDLVLPLRDRRAVRLEADLAEETATEFRKHLYAFDNVDVILLEGSFLLKRELRGHYDLSVWVDCTFETALERAIARGQEGLAPEATAEVYRTLYFAAQQIHLLVDAPVASASCILKNDPRLEGFERKLPV